MHISYLERRETITGQSYIETALKSLIESIKTARPKIGTKNLKLHHDNARPHIQNDVTSFLIEQDLEIIEHPPYSPDLAPCVFWLFDLIIENLVPVEDVESLYTSITSILAAKPQIEYKKLFDKWVERMELCIKYKGDYLNI